MIETIWNDGKPKLFKDRNWIKWFDPNKQAEYYTIEPKIISILYFMYNSSFFDTSCWLKDVGSLDIPPRLRRAQEN